jgi:DNA-binding CsgD family transcriptional regulator
MFNCTENKLNQLVRIAWQLGLAAGNRNPNNESEVMLNAIAAHLHATGWSSHKGTWSRDLSHPKITWTQTSCSPLFPQSTYYLQMSLMWHELIENAIDQEALVSTVVSYDCDVKGADYQWHVLLRIILYPDGKVECVAFAKPSYEATFSEIECAFVDAMLANPNSVPVQVTTDESEMLAKISLPKRQREVLELLLQGASLKEIASELRISRHTVNDYSKALYRHFDVSGRAELAAIFRNSAHLELSHAQ